MTSPDDNPTTFVRREARLYILGSAFQALGFGLLVVMLVSLVTSGAWVIPSLFAALIAVFVGNVLLVQVRLRLRERGALPDPRSGDEPTEEQQLLARKLVLPFALMTEARTANRS